MTNDESSLWSVLHARDQTIEQTRQELSQMQRLLEEKEAQILRHRETEKKLLQELQGRKLLRLLRWVLGASVARCLEPLAPRLGVLRQHSPRNIDAFLTASSPPSISTLRFSIVTPSFNQAAFIRRTIASVLSQNYPQLEYIVQDGQSKDGTQAVLAEYASSAFTWCSEPDSGQSQAINRGFARTQGDIMGWLNSDDILLPGALTRVADFFERHPDVDVVYGHRLILNETDQKIGHWILPRHEDRILDWADLIPQETLFWRRTLWRKSGATIDESLRFAMDWDLLLRFKQAGARFARLPYFLGGFRVHSEQKTSAQLHDVGTQEMELLRQRTLGRNPAPVELQRALYPYLLRHARDNLVWQLIRKVP